MSETITTAGNVNDTTDENVLTTSSREEDPVVVDVVVRATLDLINELKPDLDIERDMKINPNQWATILSLLKVTGESIARIKEIVIAL